MNFDYYNNLEKIVKQIKKEETGENESYSSESDLFSEETFKMIQEAKNNNKNSFQSYWEYDENNIDGWTKKQIEEDPFKQFVTFAENGNLDKIKLLLNEKSKSCMEKFLTFKDSDGYTALHRAAYSNNLEVVKYLTYFEKALTSLDVRTDMGWTPLHSAVYWNSFKVVEFLLKYTNMNVNLQSFSGQTCLHLAAQQNDIKESLLLLIFNPFINFELRNDQNESALDFAKRYSKYNYLFEIIEIYLNRI